MKTITIIFTLLFSFTVLAQNPGSILFIEQFNSSSVPTGWETFNDAISSGTQDWIFGTTDMPTGVDFDNNAAIFDDFAAGNTGLRDRKHMRMTIPVDVTNYEHVKIGFEYALQENAGNGKLQVAIGHSPNFYLFQQYVTNTDPTYVEYDLESFISSHGIPRDQLHVDFVYDDENSGQNWGAGIGVIKIIGYPINPAVNSLCENAIDITSEITTNTFFDDEKDTNGSNGVMANVSGCGAEVADGVWYKFTPTTPGNLSLQALPFYWDCHISVYTGTCGSYTCIGFADDVFYNTEEELTVALETDVDYYINIGCWSTMVENYGGLLFSHFEWVDTTSVEDTFIEGFKIYPNPTENILKLSAQETIKTIVVNNLLGQEILKFQPNSRNYEFDTSHLSSGTYIVKVAIGDKTTANKIFKK